MLLVHGNGSWSFLYRHVIAKLAPHFRCIAFDHAGFGLSQARPGLRNLGLDVLEVVNLRVMFDAMKPAEGSIASQVSTLLELQREGKIRHIGLSNVTPKRVEEGRSLAKIACVQNMYNLAHRNDDALVDTLAAAGIAYVPFFPLGGFSPLQSTALSEVAKKLGATPMQVALAWLLRRAPNILLIPGTSSVAHLRENLAHRPSLSRRTS